MGGGRGVRGPFGPPLGSIPDDDEHEPPFDEDIQNNPSDFDDWVCLCFYLLTTNLSFWKIVGNIVIHFMLFIWDISIFVVLEFKS